MKHIDPYYLPNFKWLLLLSALFICLPLFSQRHDANWPFGFQEYPGDNAFGNGVVHFLPDSTVVTPVAWKINFENTVGAMSDADGNLLFTTNGCNIYNADGEAMEAITEPGVPFTLTYGTVTDLVCAEFGYPAPNGIIALPWPGSDSLYALLYLTAEYLPDKKWNYYALANVVKIDMSANAGKGQVIAPPPPVFWPEPVEPFAAVRHGNGRDWWVMMPVRNTNSYSLYRLSPENFQKMGNKQKIGPPADCPRIGSTAFSPDGRKYARTDNCRTVVFDFDRCTGQLSNPVVFERPDFVFGGGGGAFSPDGNRLFVTEQLAVLSADLTSATPSLDTLVPSTDMIGVSLGLLQAAPDGRLYANSTHRSRYMASFKQINSTNVDFQKQGLSLGKFSARSLPYFPNYRLYDLPGSPCDTLGISPQVNSDRRVDVSVYPNPFSESLSVRLGADIGKVLFRLIDQTGRLTISRQLPPGNTTLRTGHLPAGIYFWEFITANGDRQVGKVIKAE